MISKFIFTVYIINVMSVSLARFPNIRIKYCLTEVKAIRDQRHSNLSKQITLLADVDVAPSHGSD